MPSLVVSEMCIRDSLYGVKVVLDLYDDLQGFSLGLENLIAKKINI